SNPCEGCPIPGLAKGEMPSFAKKIGGSGNPSADSLPADAAEVEQRQCSWRNRSENGSQKIIRAARMILADGDCHAFRRLLSRFRHRSLAVPCHIRLMARTPIAKRTEQPPQSRAVSG